MQQEKRNVPPNSGISLVDAETLKWFAIQFMGDSNLEINTYLLGFRAELSACLYMKKRKNITEIS